MLNNTTLLTNIFLFGIVCFKTFLLIQNEFILSQLNIFESLFFFLIQ